MKRRLWLMRPAILAAILWSMPQAGTADDFTISTNQGAAVITKYNGASVTLEIPSLINGLPVVSIGDYAFVSSKTLAQVTLPQSVTNIGRIAFGACSSLTTITIPDRVLNIGGSAFQYCSNLTQASLGTGLLRIEERAFADCLRLTNISVHPANGSFASVDGVLFTKDEALLLQCPGGRIGTYAVPETVSRIDNSAFFGCADLEDVQLPQTLASIGDSAFFGCSSLETIRIPLGVTNIESRAFDSCTRLSMIAVEENNPVYLSLDGVLLCRDHGYSLVQYPAGKTAPDYTIPDGVTALNYRSFSMCANLVSITLPSMINYIGERAFSGCTGLRELRFRGNAPTIGSLVFEGVTDARVWFTPGTTGWEETFGGLPVFPWNENQVTIVACELTPTQFNLTISGPLNRSVVVEAAHELASPIWVPIARIQLTGQTTSFHDPDGPGHLRRFYRIRQE